MDEKTREAMAYLKRTIDRYEGYAGKAIDVNGRNALAHLQAMAESEAGLRAENERLKKENVKMSNSTAKEVICCRCGKGTLFYTIACYGSVDDGDAICAECLDGTDWKDRAEKAEAELDAARPLLEAIACLKGLDFEELDWPTISIRYNAEDYYWHLRAAKEGKG